VTLVLLLSLCNLLLLLSGCQQSKPGTATQLAFGTQPTTTPAGENITPAVTVRVLDADGKLVTTATMAVTLALANNPGGGTLSGTLTVNAVKGIATFPVLSISTAGTGCTLRATAASLTSAVSASFDVTGGLPVKLGFLTQPSTTTVGAVITPAVSVAVQDAAGNTITSGSYEIGIVFIVNPTGTPLLGTLTRSTVNGIATFDDLSVGKAGVGYKIYATCTGLTPARSALFNILAGPPAKLAFGVQPANAAAATAITPAVTVRVLDALDNLVTTATTAVTLAIDANPGSGTLSGTKTNIAVGGVATFNNLSIDKIGTGYTLQASATDLTSATSMAFNITVGAPAQLAFAIQPTSTQAGSAITPAATVRLLDAGGNLVTNTSSSVTLAIAANPGGGALSGIKTHNTVAGVATFSNLSIDKIGTGYTLQASATGLTAATSTAFTITPGAPAQLAFGVQPTHTTAGQAITPAVTVRVLDAFGNLAPTATNAITLAVGANPGSGALSGTLTQDAAGGTATFTNLSIDKVGIGYTLHATATVLTPVNSTAFNITPGAPAELAFGVQPSNTAAAASMAPAVTVRVLDAQGNLATSATTAVTLAIGNNPGGGTLSGTKTVAAVGGVATFNGLSMDKTGAGYTLRATATGVTAVTSNTFTITAGPAAQLIFGVQPTDTPATDSITPAVTVRILDAGGNLATSATNAVTISIGANPAGGTLSGTVTRSAAGGIATFSDLSIEKAGSGYTLHATATNLTAATSTAFTITVGAPAKLAFGMQPSTTQVGSAIAPAVTVRVLDSQNNLVTTATHTVTLAIDTNPGGGTLSGTKTVSAVNGVATFSNLSINKTGTGYTLQATATGPTPATSSAFNITAGAPAQLDFGTQPSTTAAGDAISPAVTVQILDSQDNLVTTAGNNVTLAIGVNPGGGTLSGTKTVAAVSGVATFENLSIDKVGTGYTLQATATGLTTATSTTFNITAGAPAQLAFAVQPSDCLPDAVMSPAVTVRVLDARGNIVTTATNAITLALDDNPGGGTLSGTKTKNAVNGTATFNDLSLDQGGVGYTLIATATDLTSDTSAPFDIGAAGPPAKLAFGVQPSDTTAGDIITPAVTVRILDADDNLVISATNTITLALNLFHNHVPLSGTLTVAAVNGIATFDDLSIAQAGTDYDLKATVTGLTDAISSSFNINPGAATKLAFYTQPISTPPGKTIVPAVSVRIEDALGNTITSATDTVTLAIGTNPAGGTLSGTKTHNAVGGVATFDDLSIDQVGTGYTLHATAQGLAPDTSVAFNIGSLPGGEGGILYQYNRRLQALSIPAVTTVAESVVTYQMAHPEMWIRYGWNVPNDIGNLAFSDEFIGRSGSLVNWDYYHPAEGEVTNDIMIYAVRSWEEDAETAAAALALFNQHGYKTVLIASSAGMPPDLPHYDYFIDNGASTGSAAETRVNMIVNITLCWYWQNEYVAACTRMMGERPGIYISVELPGADVYDEMLREDPRRMYPTDARIPAGSLAQAYKGYLDRMVGQLAAPDFQGHLNNSAEIIAGRLSQGEKVGLTAWTHCIPMEIFHAVMSDFTPFTCWTPATDFKDNMDPSDLLVFFGYCGMVVPPNADTLIEEAGCDVLPSFRTVADPSKNAPYAVERLDQHWRLGDAEVDLPMEPGRMAPISVVDGLLIFRMLDEAVQQQESNPPDSYTFTSEAQFDGCTRDEGINTTSNPGAVQLAPVDYPIDHVGNKIDAASGSAYQAKKIFHLDEPQAAGATVYIFRGTAAATFNGAPITFNPVPGGRNWFVATIAPELLQQGDNELLMTSGCQVPVDTQYNAGNSFISVDDGASWDMATGELLAHLCVNRYPSQGTITSEVIDLANPDSGEIICPEITVNSLDVTYQATIPATGAIDLEVRTGNTLRPDGTWSAWGAAADLTPARFVQWRATLSTTDHRFTPVLESVQLDFQCDFTPAAKLTVNTFDNQHIVRSSFPFTYQTPSAKLTQLRTDWNLDDVVAAGATQMDKILLLQKWVRKQWPNEGSCTGPWDAIDILSKPAGDHGMCTHFATVFTQCALALGWNARHTIMQHHCAAEVWSDEYQKWVLIDEECAVVGPADMFGRYGTAQYWSGGVPLNTGEIQQAWANGDTSWITQRLYMSDDGGDTYQEYDATYPVADYDNCMRVFMTPKRNNHLDEREPWEEAQGNDYYHSNDYIFWSQGPIPDYSEFNAFSCRVADSYWTLNQAQVTLTATGDPGQLAMSVTTETPNFKEFRFRLDGGEWLSLPAENFGGISEVVDCIWTLDIGTTTLEIMPRNLFDQDGIVTTVTITRAP